DHDEPHVELETEVEGGRPAALGDPAYSLARARPGAPAGKRTGLPVRAAGRSAARGSRRLPIHHRALAEPDRRVRRTGWPLHRAAKIPLTLYGRLHLPPDPSQL